MPKQIISILLVVVALGVAVGLSIGLPSNRFNAFEDSSPTKGQDLTGYAAERTLDQIPDLVAELMFEAQTSDKTSSSGLSSVLAGLLLPKAQAQVEPNCADRVAQMFLDELMKKMRMKFEAEIAALRKQGNTIKEPCFTIKADIKIIGTIYHPKPGIIGQLPYLLQGSVTFEGYAKLFYYDENCVYKEVIKRFDKKDTQYFKWVKPGKTVKIPKLSDYYIDNGVRYPYYEICSAEVGYTVDAPMGDCPRCNIIATPTPT